MSPDQAVNPMSPMPSTPVAAAVVIYVCGARGRPAIIRRRRIVAPRGPSGRPAATPTSSTPPAMAGKAITAIDPASAPANQDPSKSFHGSIPSGRRLAYGRPQPPPPAQLWRVPLLRALASGFAQLPDAFRRVRTGPDFLTTKRHEEACRPGASPRSPRRVAISAR